MTNTPQKKLFLLDAMALIYRAYFAFISNPRYNSAGLNTSAMIGFTNTLLEVMRKENPTHLAVCFDLQGPTTRHIEFPDYKAQREAMPEDLSKSIPYIKKIIEAFNIPILALEGYEADDIIGTLAKKAEKEGFATYMMTPDKDYGQLVSDNIFMYKPAKFGKPAEVLGSENICAKYNIKHPEQFIDILGLCGDAADNIPGVKGVGEKTAMSLISLYGSVEGVYENIEAVKGKLKDKLIEHKELAFLSKKLATIILDVPVHLDIDAIKISEINREAVKEVFGELELRQLTEKVLGEGFKKQEVTKTASPQMDLFGSFENIPEPTVFEENKGTFNATEKDYQLIDTTEKRAKLITDLLKQKEFCFDTETDSLNAKDAQLVGFSFSYKANQAFYIPCLENREETTKIIQEFKPVFESENILKIGQNLKYDLAVLRNYNITLKGNLFDTMLAHYLLEPEGRHGMDVLSENYLNYTPISIETLIGKKGKNQGNMRDVAIEKIVDYAAEDADITFQLKQIFEPKLKEYNALEVFNKIENPLIEVLEDMEREGISLNSEALHEYSKDLEIDLLKLQEAIFKAAGHEFNISSPKQMGVVLFDELKLNEKAKKTKTGQYSTGEEVLSKLAGEHQIIRDILEFRSLSKLKSTYVDSLPKEVHEKTNKIHTSYNQAVAATGRLSSNYPNLQNIPIRTEKGREIRKAFIPQDAEHTLMAADYSQIELRVIAELSKEEHMLEAFKNGADIHAATAAKVYKVNLGDVTSEQRRNAKMVNFGIIYGISAFGLSERLAIPRSEAADIIKQYFIEYPKIQDYMDNQIEYARKNGYVETIMGRRRYLRDITSKNSFVRSFAERNAINAPIQGSAADLIKIAMINIWHEMKKRELKSKMILQVHDELVFETHLSEVDELKALVKDKMENAVKLSVPLDVEIATGNNWLEAH